jgi:hypothetical protein
MRGRKLLLWGGMVVSVLACVVALVGGALALFYLDTGGGTPASLGRALTLWVVSFAGTFVLSVVFFILMLRKGMLGR